MELIGSALLILAAVLVSLGVGNANLTFIVSGIGVGTLGFLLAALANYLEGRGGWPPLGV